MQPSGGEKQPKIEFAPAPEGEAETSSLPERGPVSSPENNPQTRPQQIVSQVANDLALPATAIVTTDDQVAVPQAQDSVTTSANDSDRIEKQWIDRIKAVSSQTKDDPFEQKKAMSRVSADYIQKRFNKTVSTDDSVK